MIRVSSNIREVKRTLRRWQRDQVPFAASVAINNTAFKTKDHLVQKVWPRSFPNAKNQRFPRAMFRVQKSTKRRLQAAIFDALDRVIIDKNIEGGTRFGRGGRIAIPTDNVKRTATGRARKGDRPANLKNAFIRPIRGGEGLFSRRRKARDSHELMYILRPSTSQPKLFPFYREGERYAARIFDAEFEQAIAKALRTARRR